jgi:hypothetical protein
MWHESMEILAEERIRGMNIGALAWANSPAALVFRIENCHLEWMAAVRGRRSAAKASDKLQLVPDFDPAMTYLSGWQLQEAVRFPLNAGDPEGRQSGPKLHHPQAPVERDHVDRKQHAKSMNAG